MNDESLNETSTAAKPVSIRRRRFPLKIAVSAVVGSGVDAPAVIAESDEVRAWPA